MRTPLIRTHLLLLVLAVSIPLMAVVGYGIYSDMQQTIASTKTSLRILASTMVSNTGGKIVTARQTLERLAVRPLVTQVDSQNCDGILKDLHNLNPGYANVTYTNLEGLAVCSAVPQPGGASVNVGKTPWFQRFLKERRFSIGQPFFGPITGKWVSVLSAPIWNERHEMIGAVQLPLDLAAFDPDIPAQFLPTGSRYGFIGENAILIWRNVDPEGLIGSQTPSEAARQIFEVQDGEFESLSMDGVTRYFSVVPMAQTGWVAYVGVPASEVYAAARKRALTTSVIALAAITLMLLVAIAIARRIARPVVELEKAARAVEGGNLEVRAAVAGPREIAAVAHGFNAMIEAQQRSNWQLRAFLENSAIIAWLKDEESRFVFVSDNFLARFALSREAVVGKTDSEIWPQAVSDELRVDGLTLLDQLTTVEAVTAVANPDGSISWWLSNKFMFQGSNGKRLFGGLAVDITERKQALTALQTSEAWFRSIFENVNTGIASTDRSGRITRFNEAFRAMLGYDAQTLERMNFRDFTHPDDLQLEIVFFDEILAGKRNHYHVTKRYIAQDGHILWVDLSAGAIRDAGGEVVNFVAVVQDITERKQAEEALRIAAAAFESQEGIVITDAKNVILRVNRSFTEITGYTAEEVVGQPVEMLRSDRHGPDFYAAMWEAIGHTGGWQGELWGRRKNGEIYPKWLTITAMKSDDGVVTHYVETETDISTRKAAEDQITHLAFYDPLTQLPNRRLLLERLQQALALSARSGQRGALLFIDLDHFKTLNDTLGHDKGDLLLQQVALRLVTCGREGDTVARLGGDEFVVLLEGLSEHPEEAATQGETVGEKILSTLNQPYLLAGHENRSTPSIGVTLFDGHQTTIEELLKQADLAMYQSKTAGRNTLRFFDPKMQALVSERAALEVDLREAVRQQQFILYYQPQVIGEGRITGAEALLRWRHPQRGLVSPAEFIPLAEESGLILQLGQWVLQTACAQLAAWGTQPNTAHLLMAVNVSANQLHQGDFVDQVLAVLGKTGANPKKLKLELTESQLVSDVENTIAKMSTLKAHGVGFSLDDFGTGYSSLSYLKRLPLDQLKIDQGFVRDILIDPNDAAIAKMVVALAESMGLTVIAEGVEIEAQRDFLSRLGCHAYQGYLFSRPLPLAEFEALLRRV